MFVCDNCGKRFEKETELRFRFPHIPDLTQRIEPGGMVPAGDCPWCASLVYPCGERSESCVLAALTHAEERLNAIRHNYADTDFKLIRDGIAEAKRPTRVLVLLDGGLVQDVVADKQGVEAAVLDQDLEGADEEGIVEVVGQVDTLRGKLSAHEVTVAPALIESAWRPEGSTITR